MATILVADDTSRLRFVTRLVLEAAGHEVVEAADGAEACWLVERHRFDLVLTDFRMPGLDGLEVLRHVRRTAPGTAVVLMSAEAGPVLRHDAVRLGALAYLRKPFGAAELLRVVGSGLPALRPDSASERL